LNPCAHRHPLIDRLGAGVFRAVKLKMIEISNSSGSRERALPLLARCTRLAKGIVAAGFA
jgi:hypothetical protein